MSLRRSVLHYYEYITPGLFRNFAIKLNPDTHRTVEIFPSKASDHTDTLTLFSQKFGGRVNLTSKHFTNAKADKERRRQDPKTATLGFPTKGIRILESGDFIPLAAQEAVVDMWRAAGFKVHIVMPVRRQTKANEAFFPEGYVEVPEKMGQEFQPELWDFFRETPNPVLAQYYLTNLKLLQAYLDPAVLQKPDIPGHLLEAYREGAAARRVLTETGILPPQYAWYSSDPNVYKHYKRPALVVQPPRQVVEPDPELEQSVKREQNVTPPPPSPEHKAAGGSDTEREQKKDPESPLPQPAVTSENVSEKKEKPKREVIDLQAIYAAQEKARRWKTALAVVIGFLTFPTIIVPALSYYFWRKAKRNELVQRMERPLDRQIGLNIYTELLDNMPKLADPSTVPLAVITAPESKGPDATVVSFMDREKAERERALQKRWESEPDLQSGCVPFFRSPPLKVTKPTPLNTGEDLFYIQNEAASAQLMPELRAAEAAAKAPVYRS